MSEAALGKLGPGGGTAESPDPTAWYHWRQWLKTITHASRFYWSLQVINALGSVFLTVQILRSAAQMSGDISGHGNVLAGAVLDAVMLLATTHLLIRPLLLGTLVHQRPTARAWGVLAAALLFSASITVLAGDLLTSLSLQHRPVQEIRFNTGAAEFGVALVGWQLFVMQVVNALAAYMLWVAVYLGWKAIEARRELSRQVRHARLWQLTRQMGPHFLFNAFNSIRGLMYEDRDRAAQLITRLSDLLRVQLGLNEDTHQSLRDECRMARDYLEIELARLEPRLAFSFDVPRDCEQFVLPTLTVLTAVENAIKHGIVPNTGPGWIRISAHRGVHGCVLEVANSYGAPSSAESTGIGLKNLRERLLLSTNGAAKVEQWTERDTFHLRMEIPE
ncbi:sensor histidine kinase [Lysobacter sp. A3-1-A15]|uniref:sensor histidine kinase n=1 Tax=Novilysobacter viscosus TaxID=3098602 RepID=UPI002ED9DA10